MLRKIILTKFCFLWQLYDLKLFMRLGLSYGLPLSNLFYISIIIMSKENNIQYTVIAAWSSIMDLIHLSMKAFNFNDYLNTLQIKRSP